MRKYEISGKSSWCICVCSEEDAQKARDNGDRVRELVYKDEPEGPIVATTQDECRRKFDKSVLAMRSRIDHINLATPWSDVEPAWWLEMMEIDKRLREYQEKNP